MIGKIYGGSVCPWYGVLCWLADASCMHACFWLLVFVYALDYAKMVLRLLKGRGTARVSIR